MKIEDKQAKDLYLAKLRIIREVGSFDPFETKVQQKERITRAKKHIRFFVETYLTHYASSKSAWFHIRLAELVIKYKILLLFMMWGRALAKSVWADVIIPLFLWINDDIGYMVIVGNTETHAKILLSDLQAEFEANSKLIHDFGEQKLKAAGRTVTFKLKTVSCVKRSVCGRAFVVCVKEHGAPTILWPMTWRTRTRSRTRNVNARLLNGWRKI